MGKQRLKFWTFRAATDNPSVGELLIYGPISDYSWWGDEVTPRQFYDDLKALGEIDELRVYINSGGGDVFAGQAIHSMLKRHSATITVYVDGLAASAASVIAMAGDTIIMPRNAMMMIHNPWTIALGEARDLRKLADDLDKIRETLVAAYEEKSGLPADEIRTMMDDETWLTADEAVAKGLADQVEESKAVAAAMRGTVLAINGHEFDLSKYRRPPKLVAAVRAPEPPPEPQQSDPPRGTRRETAPLSIYERLIALNERRLMK